MIPGRLQQRAGPAMMAGTGSGVADYQTVEWQGIRVMPRPREVWRRVPILRTWPFRSGRRFQFDVLVEATRSDRERDRVQLEWTFISPGGEHPSTATLVEDLGSRRVFSYRTPWLGGSGHHRLDATIRLVDADATIRETLVDFDLASADSLRLWWSAILFSLIVTLVGGVLGGLCVATWDSGPKPVVIVTPAGR
jgi:hypothetical protein